MRIRALLFAIGLAVGGAVPAGAAGRATPPDEAVGYWTAERVQGAQPRDVVLDGPRGPVQPRPKPDNPGNKPDKNPDEEPDDTGGTDTTVITGAPWPDTEGDPVDDLVGKVLFTLGGADYVCSASTIAPSDASDAWTVMTAGHCAWDDAWSWATNWVFVPDYETVRTFGCSPADDSLGTSSGACYAAASLHAHADWMAAGDDYGADVAFARMADARPRWLDVGADLPVLKIATAVGVQVTALGYPAAKKYHGADLIHCAGVPVPGPSVYAENPGLACDMTGGSSGGPWYHRTADGTHEAISLNSFGLRGYNGTMFGPAFDGGAWNALVLASTATP